MPGNYDGAAHLKDMEPTGSTRRSSIPQMVYRAYTGLADRDLGLECLKVFNDWMLDEFCAVDPNRLIGMCMVPWEHPIEVLTAELERVLKKGAKAIFLPYTMNPPLYAPYWDPHVGADHRRQRRRVGASAVRRQPATRSAVAGRFEEELDRAVNIVMGYFAAIQPLTELIYTGLFDRFPTLKFVHAEVDWGGCRSGPRSWTRWCASTATGSTGPMQLKPSEYFGRNVFLTGLDDVEGFRRRAGKRAGRRAARCSRSTTRTRSRCSAARRKCWRADAGLDADVKRAMLAGTAMKVFNLPGADAEPGPAIGRERVGAR